MKKLNFKATLIAALIAVNASVFVQPAIAEVPMSDKSALEIVNEMKFGWNLGNTFDAFSAGDPSNGFSGCPLNAGLKTQTSWGQPVTTQAMIAGIKAKGFSTIRIPTSWHGHFIDKDYTIDPDWMACVKEVVDWSINEGLFVVLNIHHDNVAPGKLSYGKGFSPNSKDKDESLKFMTRVWQQISENFNNDYDEHLVFEVLNEPRLIAHEHEWNFEASCAKCQDAAKCINEFNQACVDTIRASGGNNSKRLLMIPSYVAAPYSAFNPAFKMPNDEAGKLALSTHMYTPYPFAMQSPGEKIFSDKFKNELNWHFEELNRKFCAQGIPVVIGEMGVTNKDNLKERKAWFKYYLGKVKDYEMAAILWDNGNWKITGSGSNRYEEHFGYYNRENQTWFFDGLVEEGIKARN